MRIILALMLSTAAQSPVMAKSRVYKETAPEAENWHATSMEASAVLGEIKLQQSDVSGARDTFRDSLNSSTRVYDPRSPIMGLNLYRSAELALIKGEIATARHHLDILIHRFPDSEWSAKGRGLLDAISASGKYADGADTPLEPVSDSAHPEARLGLIQAAVKSGRLETALGLCEGFVRAYPEHPLKAEVVVLAGALELEMGRPREAAETLRRGMAQARDSELRAKAAYLLGGAAFTQDDCKTVENIGGGSGKWQAQAQVWKAACANRDGRRQNAAAAYRTFVESPHESPIKAYAYAALGADWERQGRSAQALATMKRASASAERWSMTSLAASLELTQANLLYNLKDFTSAAQAYGNFASTRFGHPQTPFALYQRGLSLRRSGSRSAAVAAFQQLTAMPSESSYTSGAHLQLGQLYAELGENAKAVENYGRVEGSESLPLIAQVHYNNKRYKDAIPLYWKYLENAPKNARSSEIEELLLTSYWMGDRENPGLYKAAALYPNHPIVAHIRWELGAKAYKRGDYREAADLFARFEAENPASAHLVESLFYRAECLAKLGQPQAAAELYRKIFLRFPESAQAKQSSFKMGAAFYDAGDYQASADAYARVTNGKDAADAAFNRALALDKAGRKGGALAAYERLLTQFPRYEKAGWAWFKVGEMRQALGHLKPAMAAYQKATVNRTQAMFNIGRCAERLRLAATARKAYEKLLIMGPAADPFRLQGLLRLGLIYEINNQPLKAMKLYGEILKRAPHGEVFQHARKRVQILTADGSLLSRR